MDNPQLNLFQVQLMSKLSVETEYLSETLVGMTRLHLPGFVNHMDLDWL